MTPGSNSKVWWICSQGHEFKSTICNRSSSRKSGCPFCYRKNEAIVKTLLSGYFNDWTITSHKKIWDTYKDYNYRRNCDFWLEKDNIKVMVEYDGEQHYRPVTFGCKDKEKVMEIFKRTQLKDLLDFEFCLENNIILHRIKYDEDKEESIKGLLIKLSKTTNFSLQK